MKILYAIQGTGNGHICRAKEIIPHLAKYGELDVLVSGIQADLELPFPIKYSFKGMSFVFGKNGGIDMLNTYMKNHINRFIAEVKSLPIEDYDLIINDFEPISAWAAYFKGKTCIGLSNQCAIKDKVVHQKVSDDRIGKFILNNYAPNTVDYGFHYEAHLPFVFTPIIRKEIRSLKLSNEGHYTVYLPSYSDKRIVKKLNLIPNVEWQVFSKHSLSESCEKNVYIRPIHEDTFLKSIASSAGVLCAAGFGTTTEALFLGKKLLVIPQKQQYEQQCNANALKKMGVPIVKQLRKKHLEKIVNWVESDHRVKVNFPDQTALIIETIIANELDSRDNYLNYLTNEQYSLA